MSLKTKDRWKSSILDPDALTCSVKDFLSEVPTAESARLTGSKTFPTSASSAPSLWENFKVCENLTTNIRILSSGLMLLVKYDWLLQKPQIYCPSHPPPLKQLRLTLVRQNVAWRLACLNLRLTAQKCFSLVLLNSYGCWQYGTGSSPPQHQVFTKGLSTSYSFSDTRPKFFLVIWQLSLTFTLCIVIRKSAGAVQSTSSHAGYQPNHLEAHLEGWTSKFVKEKI